MLGSATRPETGEHYTMDGAGRGAMTRPAMTGGMSGMSEVPVPHHLGTGSAALTYFSYLALDEVLGARRPRSEEHDEILFVVIHHDLWAVRSEL